MNTMNNIFATSSYESSFEWNHDERNTKDYLRAVEKDDFDLGRMCRELVIESQTLQHWSDDEDEDDEDDMWYDMEYVEDATVVAKDNHTIDAFNDPYYCTFVSRTNSIDSNAYDSGYGGSATTCSDSESDEEYTSKQQKSKFMYT
jgi:hypothetical protein